MRLWVLSKPVPIPICNRPIGAGGEEVVEIMASLFATWRFVPLVFFYHR